MKKSLRELLYDIKEPGINIHIIPLICLLYIMCAYTWHTSLGKSDNITLAILEFIVPFTGGYSSVMLMQGVMDTDGCEIMFSYPKSTLYWGIVRQLRFLAIFSILIIGVSCCIATIMQISYIKLIVLTFFQSIATMAVAFLGVTISQSVSVGIIILLSFVVIQMTLGREFDIFNWLFVLDGTLPGNGQILSICIRSCMFCIFAWPIGQIWVAPSGRD